MKNIFLLSKINFLFLLRIFLIIVFFKSNFFPLKAGIQKPDLEKWQKISKDFFIDTIDFSINKTLIYTWIREKNYKKRRLTIDCENFLEKELFENKVFGWNGIKKNTEKFEIANQLCFLTKVSGYTEEPRRRQPSWAKKMISLSKKSINPKLNPKENNQTSTEKSNKNISKNNTDNFKKLNISKQTDKTRQDKLNLNQILNKNELNQIIEEDVKIFMNDLNTLEQKKKFRFSENTNEDNKSEIYSMNDQNKSEKKPDKTMNFLN